MIGWMRVVLPRGWVLGLFAFGYVLLEGLDLYFSWRHPSFAAFAKLRNAWVFMACLLYGAYRVVGSHPLFQPAYRKWLEATPWTSRLPLPAGPIHLVWQDVVVLLVAEALLQRYVLTHWTEPLRLFLSAYLLCCVVVLGSTSQRAITYGLAFGLGLVVRLAGIPPASLTVELPLYLLAYLGLRRSLATFPWDPVLWKQARGAWVWNQPILGEGGAEP